MKCLNLVVGGLEENTLENAMAMLEENINTIEFVLNFENGELVPLPDGVLPNTILSNDANGPGSINADSEGEATIINTNDTIVEPDDIPAILHKEKQHIEPEPSFPPGTTVKNADCTEDAESDSSFNPSLDGFDSDSSVDNGDIGTDVCVANQINSSDAENKVQHQRST